MSRDTRGVGKIVVKVKNKTQQCWKCKKWKQLSEFSKNKNYLSGHQTLCKSCDSERKKQNALYLHSIVNQYKQVGCVMCGYVKHFEALDMHHIEPKGKEFNIGHSATRITESNLLKEMQKCCIICSNCHRVLHKKYRG